MASAAELASWRKAFEKLGAKTMRLRIENPRSGVDGEYLRAAEQWLAEQDTQTEKREKTRYTVILCWTIVAAIASVIAAITGIIAVWPSR
jgi:hypothetical protein